MSFSGQFVPLTTCKSHILEEINSFKFVYLSCEGPPALIVIISMAANIEGFGVKVGLIMLDEDGNQTSTNRSALNALR